MAPLSSSTYTRKIVLRSSLVSSADFQNAQSKVFLRHAPGHRVFNESVLAIQIAMRISAIGPQLFSAHRHLVLNRCPRSMR